MPRRLAASEIQLIMSMAAQIGVAVENARLYGDLKNKTALLEQTNVETSKRRVTPNRSLWRRRPQPERRTPLNVINGIVQLMMDRFFGGLTEETREIFGKVVHHGRILLKLINECIDPSRN